MAPPNMGQKDGKRQHALLHVSHWRRLNWKGAWERPRLCNGHGSRGRCGNTRDEEYLVIYI